MALTISKLKMWKDPGYTRGCLEVPPAGSLKLPAVPDYTLAADETLRPHKGSTLTELHLPLSFTQTFGMSYLYIEATDGAGSVSLFGWITSIDQRSTAAEGITIRWDVDWWRSYSGSVTFGRGVITKTSSDTYKRPMPSRPRRWEYSNIHNFMQHLTGGYLNNTFLFSYFDSNGKSRYGVTASLFKLSGVSYSGLGPYEIQSLSSAFNIPSSSIKGCWSLSYINSGFSYESGALVFPNGTIKTHNTRSWVEYEDFNAFWSTALDNTVTWTTDDTNRTQLLDSFGTPYLTVPYGFDIKSISIKMDIGVTEAYYYVILSESATPVSLATWNTEIRKAIAEGRFAIIPLVPIAVSSSALSDYYSTGQRDYDVETRRMQQERDAWSGFLGIGGSVAGGTISGAVSTGNPAGAAAGAAAGAVSSIGGTIANYWLTEEFNDRLQNATEKLYSNQASQLITIGSTLDKSAQAPNGFKMIKLTADSVSAAEILSQISTQGYDVDIPAASCSSFITSGPVQIKNLQLGGNAPPQAKQYIKDKLSAGVYIVENNSSGVAP